MKPNRTQLLAIGLALAGLVLIGGWVYRPVAIELNGETTTIRTAALTTGGVLQAANVSLDPSDSVFPTLNSLLLGSNRIVIRRGEAIQIWEGDRKFSLTSPQRIIANLVMLAGIRLFPGDQVLVNGVAIDPQSRISDQAPPLIQVRPAVAINLNDNGSERQIFSAAATMGDALWQAGIRLAPADRMIPPANSPLNGTLTARIQRARDLDITTAGGDIHIRSAAQKVGQALSEAGLSLQGLDYSLPAEDQPIPANGQIRLINVDENILLQQKQLPYKTSYQADPNTELDQHSVVVAGVPGLEVTRIRVRSEDGKEVSRQTEAQWTARQPQDQVLGYGTKVVVRTEVVEGKTITYWRKITAYATAYSACDAGACGRATASGLPVTHGVIAVIPSWYYAMKFQQVYIPGYGQATIADIGGGIAGTNWVDLGFPENEYTSWHSNVDVYFLTPVPANILWELP
jgi:uncharacterized protein YabE (DUF348 family)